MLLSLYSLPSVLASTIGFSHFPCPKTVLPANAIISGSDPSACLVLAAIGSSVGVWLLVLEATGSSSATPTGISVGSSACD